MSVLSVLRHLNYTYWHAVAEFVDNSLQSYLSNRASLALADGREQPLEVKVLVDQADGGTLIVRDTAAGIALADFPRAFRPAEAPPDRTGLSEFGMGMKSASCWCAATWEVRTSPIGDPTEYSVDFDVAEIVAGRIEEIAISRAPASADAHYTEVRLVGLHRPLAGRTLVKVKQHLADIYREFIRTGALILTVDGDVLRYEDPAILTAGYYKDDAGPPRLWRSNIDFDFGNGLSVRGFAAIREKASTSRAGFALFRRGRVIQGSGDEGYRPEAIFGPINKYVYQRLFGELHLDGFAVSHTKDGFKWDENEEPFLELLNEQLNSADMPLLQQARNYRVNDPEEMEKGARAAGGRAAGAVEANAPPIIDQLQNDPTPVVPPELPPAPKLTRKVVRVRHAPFDWEVAIEMTSDAGADWLEVGDAPPQTTDGVRTLALRLSLAHPFMKQFAGGDAEIIEPLLRVAVALGLADTLAREMSAPASTVRRNVNALLKRALSRP
ncbi:MAG: ATP-binding protein [Myxococcota bacterium]